MTRLLKELEWWLLLGFAIMIGLMILSGKAAPAILDPNYHREKTPLACQQFPWPLVAEDLVNTVEQRGPYSGRLWVAHLYDHNHDGLVDTITLTHPLARFPDRYGFDENFDGVLDWLFQDTAKNGRCDALVILRFPKNGAPL